jgi:hypothetical protein
MEIQHSTLGRNKRKYKDTAYSKNGDLINYMFKKHEFCRQKFKENRILTINSLYVLEVLCFIGKSEAKLCDP